MDMASRPGYVVALAYCALIAGCAAAYSLAGMVGVLVLSALVYGITRLRFLNALPSPVLAGAFACLVVLLFAVRAAAMNATRQQLAAAPMPTPTVVTPQAPPAPAPAPTKQSAAGTNSWEQTATAFETEHPELKLGRNYQIMQAALDRQPTSLDDAQLLTHAFAEAKQDPAWVNGDDALDQNNPVRRFAMAHPDLLLGSNLALMKAAVGEVATPALSDEEIVNRAYRLAQEDPRWDWGTVSKPPSGYSYSANTPLPFPPAPAPELRQADQCAACEQPLVQLPSMPQWQQSQVQDMPGAVMVSPDQALNPYNGHIVQLEPAVPGQPNQPRVRSQGGSAEADIECAQARQAGWGGEERNNCAMGLGPDGQP